MTHILESRPHPEQGYRGCLGIMRLARNYGNQRTEAACRRALAADACSFRSIQSILKTKLDQQPLPESDNDLTPTVLDHDNIRGEAYYQTPEELKEPLRGP